MNDFPRADEFRLAQAFGIDHETWRDGRTYPALAEKLGQDYELTLPAGSVVQIGGHRLVLKGPVIAHSPDPCVLIEGDTQEGTEAHDAWPEIARMKLVPRRPRSHRRCVLVYLDADSVPHE